MWGVGRDGAGGGEVVMGVDFKQQGLRKGEVEGE